MSIGCGTLASPSGFAKGTLNASSSNGKQHTLPKSPRHHLIEHDDVQAYWSTDQSKSPTRLWGTTKATKYGGEERLDGEPDLWLNGEYWNIDSNIRKWGLHEVRRNAAAASHDVHRHDQIHRMVLPPQPGDTRPLRQCVSGVVSSDCGFLEAWGFDLGLRDRQAQPAPLWKPVTRMEQFRSERSFKRNLARMAESSRTLRQSASTPGVLQSLTLRPEDIGGEAGEVCNEDDANFEKAGRPFGSRSCRGWDGYEHTVKREAAKMSCSIHSPCVRAHHDHPYGCDAVAPAAVYTRRFQRGGEEALRSHVSRAIRVPMS